MGFASSILLASRAKTTATVAHNTAACPNHAIYEGMAVVARMPVLSSSTGGKPDGARVDSAAPIFDRNPVVSAAAHQWQPVRPRPGRGVPLFCDGCHI
jgi:hypothetical protein